MKYLLYICAFITLTFSVIYVVHLYELFCANQVDTEYYPIYGVLGDFVGGIIGTIINLITLVLVYFTFVDQKKELKIQKELTTTQQFENTFFSLLNVHRELKTNLSFDERFSITALVVTLYNSIFSFPNHIPTYKNYLGVDIFPMINDDMINIYRLNNHQNRINDLIQHGQVYPLKKELLDRLKKMLETYPVDKIDITDLMEIQKETDEQNVVDFEKNKINDLFEIIFFVYKNQISHYCRNVYHILKFIRENEDREPNSKAKYKQYANLFQSQLNVSEQVLLFYNFFHFNDEEKGIYSTINLVNHYSFLENVGIENLLNDIHTKFYNIDFK